MVSAAKERDTSDVLRRSTRSSRAKPPQEVEIEEDASCAELRKSSTLGHNRSKSSGKGKGKGPIEVIEEADEDDNPRAGPLTNQRVKGKENVAHDAKVPRPTRNTKSFRANDTEEETRQPKRLLPKKGRAALDDREESTPDVDSESDVRPARKKRNRVIESVSSSREESFEEIKPKKVQAPVKKAKGKTPTNVLEPEDGQIDGPGDSLRLVKAFSKAPAKPRAKPDATEDSNQGSDDESEEIEQRAKFPPPLDHGKDKAQSRPVTPLESSEAVASWSSEEAVTPFPVPLEKSGKGTKGKDSKSTGAAASQHRERCRSGTTSDSNGSPKFLVPKEKANTVFDIPQDVQEDVMVIDTDDNPPPATPPRKTTVLSESMPVENMDGCALVSPARPTHSPQHSDPPALRREESPATPPPASSSLLSVSSTTSTTKVECHTDTETLVESLPLRTTNGTQLAEEERTMTVEQWIRQEIELQYERLRRDGEMKIRLFKERAEEVRRQIEAL